MISSLSVRFPRTISVRSRPLSGNDEVLAVRRFKANSQWLDNLLVAVKAIRDASDLAPFPYIRISAGIVVQALETIQAVQQNQKEFEALAESLADIIRMINDTVRSYYDIHDYSPPLAFTNICHDFVENLLKLSSDLNNIVRRNQSWKRFFNISENRDSITQFRRKIDDLRSNFTLVTVVHIAIRVCSEHMPRPLGHTWEFSKPLRFVDAMDVIVELPLDLCSTRNDFHELLKYLFRKRPGLQYVKRSDYDITSGNTTEPIDDTVWSSKVVPGSTIMMNIIVENFDIGDQEFTRCPSCGAIHMNTAGLQCTSCGSWLLETIHEGHDDPMYTPASMRASTLDLILFRLRRRRGALVRLPRGGGPGSPDEVQYFRRFHIISQVSNLIGQLTRWSKRKHHFLLLRENDLIGAAYRHRIARENYTGTGSRTPPSDPAEENSETTYQWDDSLTPSEKLLNFHLHPPGMHIPVFH